jgi:hypothetical protein
MSHARSIQLLAVLGLIACLVTAALLTSPINHQREKAQLVSVGGNLGTDTPPLVNLLVSAGGPIRGLAINFLWYHLNDLKDRGQYYACNQLAEWVAQLQPNFPQVWLFHSWNLAYNISVENLTREQRWYWVSRGIDLLRDKAIPLNPHAIFLYKELAWMFLHKVGEQTDDANYYYKMKLAEEWEEILGHPKAGQSDQDYLADFQRIVDAPYDPLDPGSLVPLQRANPGVAALLGRLGALGYHAGDPDDRMLRCIDRVYMFNAWLGNDRSGWSVAGLMASEQASAQTAGDSTTAEHFDPRLRDLLTTLDPPAQDALRDLLSYLRHRAIVQTYHMDPAFMYQLMQPIGSRVSQDTLEGQIGGYGPLDWRHPASHCLYWGAMGVRMGLKMLQNTDQDMANTHRRVIFALQLLVNQGRITYDPITGLYDQAPDIRFIPAYELSIDQSQRLEDQGVIIKGTTAGFAIGHENLLLEAIKDCRLYATREQAQAYYDKVRKLFGDKPYNVASHRYEQPLDDLVFDQLKGDIDDPVKGSQLIDGLLQRAMTIGLIENHPEAYTTMVNYARRVHDYIQKKAEHEATAINVGHRRLGLPPFEDMVAECWRNMAGVILSVLPRPDQPNYAAVARPRLLQLSGLWSNPPDSTRLRLYDQLHFELALPLCSPAGINPDRAFPAPPGMDAYRKSIASPPAQ